MSTERPLVILYPETGLLQIVEVDGSCEFSGSVEDLKDGDRMVAFVCAVVNAVEPTNEFTVRTIGDDFEGDD